MKPINWKGRTIWHMPTWVSDLFQETLQMDARSSMFDMTLRRRIQRGLNITHTMAPEEFLQAAMNRLRYFLVTNADGYACYYFDTEEERRLWLKKAIEDNIIELGEDDAVYLDMNFMNLVEDKITMYAPPTEDVLTEDPDELSDS